MLCGTRTIHCCGCGLQYILRTENPEKVPNTAECRAGVASVACGPGQFDAAMPSPAAGDGNLMRHEYASTHYSSAAAAAAASAGQQVGRQRQLELPISLGSLVDWQQQAAAERLQQPHPCCDGYFCPPALTCMLPCPLGAFCRRYASDAANLRWESALVTLWFI